jgi:3'-phosphoadenosine 5'-phosphosulfate sulfotransferase
MIGVCIHTGGRFEFQAAVVDGERAFEKRLFPVLLLGRENSAQTAAV